MSKYRICMKRGYFFQFAVQKKFWFGWFPVYSGEMSQCEHYITYALNPVVKEY